MHKWNYAYKQLLAAFFITAGTATFAQSNFALATADIALQHLNGKKKNAAYLNVTAGDRLYAIGSQDGAFPAVGFHVPGEMGGVWQHPIKLLDGFRFSITEQNHSAANIIAACDSFITYPFTSKYCYSSPDKTTGITRTQFVPDSMPLLVVEYRITNNSSSNKNYAFHFFADVNLRPVWLGERTGMNDSSDSAESFDSATHTAFFKDSRNTWYTGISCDRSIDFTGTSKSSYQGMGLTGNFIANFTLARKTSTIFRFYICGSTSNKKEIAGNIATAKQQLQQLFLAKKKRYQQLDNNALIDVPDNAIRQAYQWGKYSSDWLVRDVPGMGKAMSAGLPDYPWFFSNDQASTFSALTGTIQPDIFFSSSKMLKYLSDKSGDSTGSLIHEASSNDVVYARDRMEESQLHIITAWDIFKWTGNINFLKENYARGQKIWTWLQQHDSDHNGYIEGYGGVEIEGLNAEMLDVQLATQQFLRVMALAADILNEKDAAAGYHEKATQLLNNINRDWWVPGEFRYADFISSPQKAMDIIDTALAKRINPARNSWAQKKLLELKRDILNGSYPNKGYVVYYNTSGISPVEQGITDTIRALLALKHIGFFTNRFGRYISGIERPDDIKMDEGKFAHDEAFNYNRAVMPAATAGLAIAASRYGNADTALHYVKIMLNSFSYATPGTMYEVSPDYGMFVQAWNVRGLNVPLIQYFFGISPMAYQKTISLQPDFPAAWKHASIKNVIIGSNLLSFSYKQSAKAKTYILQSKLPGWTIELQVGDCKSILLNGKKVTANNGRLFIHEQRAEIVCSVDQL